MKAYMSEIQYFAHQLRNLKYKNIRTVNDNYHITAEKDGEKWCFEIGSKSRNNITEYDIAAAEEWERITQEADQIRYVIVYLKGAQPSYKTIFRQDICQNRA